nr:nucleotidyltransferase domain-containing protein [uncultured Psychroserpens sp.]
MKTKILEKLSEIERDKNIEILFAVESGSRAWGFESPDSDYDIRFVYKHKKAFYLNLWEQKDTIEFMTEDDLDGNGWDLKKALKLLAKSNASFLGWLFSPIIYRVDDTIISDLQLLANNNFNPVSGFYHYHSMSKGFLDKVSSEDVKLKSFFYALRSALCAHWIVKKETVPPVLFSEVLSLVDDKTRNTIENLVELKSKYNEDFLTKKNEVLFEFLKDTIAYNDSKKGFISNHNINPDEFNTLFTKHII